MNGATLVIYDFRMNKYDMISMIVNRSSGEERCQWDAVDCRSR